MKKLISFFIQRPVWGNAAIVIIVMFGLFSLFNTNRSFFPENDPRTIVVSVTYPGASPTEMEDGITIKIEQSIKGLNGIDEINSTSQENFTQIVITALEGTDMDQLFNDVDNAVNSISSFPKGTEPPTVTRLKSLGMTSVVAFVGISANDENANLPDLIDVASQSERELLNNKNITEIEKTGFPVKELSVDVKQEDLIRYNISITEIANAIRSKNIDITTGMVRGGMEELNIRSNNRTTNPEEIEEILLRTTTSGELIRVGDVADVRLTYSEASQKNKFNGRPSVTFQINKTPEQDIAKITEYLNEYKEKFDAENPDYSFDIFFEFNSMLDDRIDLLTRNGIMGLVLVLLFLGLFLNIKLSAWVAFGIPFSFLGMFIFGTAFGITINMISLFGMILVVGILVDDGIVIAENIFTHFERGKSPKQAALDGTMEVLQPVFTSVLTTIVAFGILFFVEGMELMKEMAFVVISCLIFSLFEAFIILPGHLGHKNILDETEKPKYSLGVGILYMFVGLLVTFFGTRLIPDNPTFGSLLFPFTLILLGAVILFVGFSKSPIEPAIRRNADKGIKYVRDKWYKTAVESLAKWYVASFFLPMIFAISGFVFMGMGIINFTFFPNVQPNFFTIEAVYNPGNSDTKTEAFLSEATQILIEENQRIIDENGDSLLTYYLTSVGVTRSIGQYGNHAGMIQVFFDGERSKTPVDTLISRVNRRIQELPEAKLAQGTYVGGEKRFGKEIAIGITSPVEANLLLAKESLKESLAQMKGVINIKDDMPEGKTEVEVTLLPEASILGLSEGEVLTQIRQSFFGDETQRVIIGNDEVKLWVRFAKEDRNSFDDLKRMKIRNLQGTEVELQSIATFNMTRAPETLRRIDGQRILTVDAESSDPDKVASINSDINAKVLPELYKKFPSLKTVPLGQAKRTGKIGKSIMIAFPIGVVIMFIIIMLHFNNLGNAFLIMLVIPAGVGGALIGHGIVGISVSIMSSFGIIALIGVLVNDAIVFLDRYNDLLLEGEDVKSAVLNAAMSRFRPILLTSLTTVAGLLPIITETSTQAQFLIPVAVAIAFGILFGTMFILLFYPSAILLWNGVRVISHTVMTGNGNVIPESVEPVVKMHKRKMGEDPAVQYYTTEQLQEKYNAQNEEDEII